MATELPLLRTSERSTYTRCRLRWKWGYVDRRKPKDTGKALKFGWLVHVALERYYVPGRKRGVHPVKTFLEEYDKMALEAGYDFSFQDEDEQWTEARELGEDMLTRYVDHWREEDALWEVIAPEMAADVVVKDKNGKPLCLYLMQFDAVIFHHGHGRYLFVDHKTTSGQPSEEEKELDEQCGTYWTLGPDWLKENGHIPADAEISGFLYNFLRKAMADDRPQDAQGRYLNQPTKSDLERAAEEHGVEWPAKSMKKDDMIAVLEAAEVPWQQYGAVSKLQPPPYFYRFPIYRDEADRENVLYRIRAQVHEMNLARQGKIGIYKNPMFGGVYGCPTCPFYGPCQLHESGDDWKALLAMTTDKGDPYEQYRDELDLEDYE